MVRMMNMDKITVTAVTGSWAGLAAATIFHDTALYLAILASVIAILSGSLSIRKQVKEWNKNKEQ